MTIQHLLQKGTKELEKHSKTASLDSEVLLQYVLKKDKTFLYANLVEEVSQSVERRFVKLIKRRKKREPVSYLIKRKEFYGISFKVNRDVLIPRPETEMLVEMGMEFLKKLKKGNLKLIDIGTGCGAIGIAITKELLEKNKKQAAEVWLTDISKKALWIAKYNWKEIIGKNESVIIRFRKTDLFNNVDEKFDLIVCNPPYIPSENIELLDPSIREYEPKVALNGGEGGNKQISRLLRQGVRRLRKGGRIIFEMEPQHKVWGKFFVESELKGYKINFKKDLYGVYRFGVVER